jgi:hyaluronan synthase
MFPTIRNTFAKFNHLLTHVGYYTFILLLIGVVIAGIVFIKSHSVAQFLSDPILLFYAFFITVFQLSRLVSALFYKRSYEAAVNPPGVTLPSKREYEPTISFVIPAMNEEAAISNTLKKCFAAEYPKHKVEVIVINDGSTDNTIGEILKMKQKHPELVVIDWKENRGKRHGMAEGFRRATGEIVIQLDSDSFIEPASLRTLVIPFRNPEIGAVCAHADPENADDNFMTRMQAAYYFMSFRILKAAESTYHTVFCASGCSSAYRKNIVLPVLDGWLNESFLGKPVTWGDDRALTNLVLKQGSKTIYSDVAQAFTIVPDTFRKFLKQQIRWKKGWFVNSIFAGKFIFKRDPFVALAYFYPLTFVTLITPVMATRAFVYTPIFKDSLPSFFYIFGVLLIASLIVLFYRWVSRTNKYWPYLFAWALINMVILSFLLFYALATIQNRKWSTR